MDLDFLAQADRVTLNLEMAKKAIEGAKADFEAAKRAYDELFSQAEAHGIPKAKLKKLTEERVQALLESGVLNRERSANSEIKKEKTAKKKSKSTARETVMEMASKEDSAEEVEAEAAQMDV